LDEVVGVVPQRSVAGHRTEMGQVTRHCLCHPLQIPPRGLLLAPMGAAQNDGPGDAIQGQQENDQRRPGDRQRPCAQVHLLALHFRQRPHAGAQEAVQWTGPALRIAPSRQWTANSTESRPIAVHYRRCVAFRDLRSPSASAMPGTRLLKAADGWRRLRTRAFPAPSSRDNSHGCQARARTSPPHDSASPLRHDICRACNTSGPRTAPAARSLGFSRSLPVTRFVTM